METPAEVSVTVAEAKPVASAALCTICGATSPDEGSLVKHAAEAHAAELAARAPPAPKGCCLVCGFVSTSEEELHAHASTHASAHAARRAAE